jgi:hypothetical protein
MFASGLPADGLDPCRACGAVVWADADALSVSTSRAASRQRAMLTSEGDSTGPMETLLCHGMGTLSNIVPIADSLIADWRLIAGLRIDDC